MRISKDKAVKIHFTVTDSDKNEIDSTPENEPLEFIHGNGLLIEALENALTGHEPNDKLMLELNAEKAYGPRQKALLQAMPIAMFDGMEVEPGMQFRATTDDGEHSVIVLEVDDEQIVVDGNHPLAGLDLIFDIEVIDVRDATAEELDHGHIHAAGHSCGSEMH
jgi:FKBP-type peptidyl-prolyl cis-trans isomerase SlyD